MIALESNPEIVSAAPPVRVPVKRPGPTLPREDQQSAPFAGGIHRLCERFYKSLRGLLEHVEGLQLIRSFSARCKPRLPGPRHSAEFLRRLLAGDLSAEEESRPGREV